MTQNLGSEYILSTPIIYSYQPYPYTVQGTVGISNFPATQNVNITNTLVSTPISYSYQPAPYIVIGTGALGAVTVSNLFGVDQQLDLTGTISPIVTAPIKLLSTGAGTSATPLALASSKRTRVLNYSFVASQATTVYLCATPAVPSAGNAFLEVQPGIPQVLKDSYVLAGPFQIAANGGISFAGMLQGYAFQAAASTPVYLVALGGNIGGHLSYVNV